MSNTQILSSLSICGRITLDMHSLNNEGGEGNQILTRQVTIVDDQGEIASVNAVSGDMLKHIQAEHLWLKAKEDNLNLCSSCLSFNANRIVSAGEFVTFLQGVNVEEFENNDKQRYTEIKSQIRTSKDDKRIKQLKEELNKLEKKYLLNKFSEDDKRNYSEIKNKHKNANGDEKKELGKKIKELEKKYKTEIDDSGKLDKMLGLCSLDDLEGVLVTAEGNNLPRKSCAEFGWLVALPDKSKTESFFHVKYVSDAGTTQGEEGANVGQNIFHRPANSGIYALVSNFDLYRIGYNDISKKYTITNEERIKRYKAFLQSILYTFIKPKGAMRNTQNPHIVKFEGVIATSSKTMPAPTVSPIDSEYISQVEKIKKSLNSIETDAINVISFKSIGEFSEKMVALINNSTPFKLN
ncbi:MAG: hypothetical protein SCARUB_03347 [Candidatus Scalindua rubra]|uniref:CRISPR-associated protein n=1 Tax=Candidatus Scalindua rubra TaxID=1872076 RepID=A0A1E3X988_9BACT|nr:MAG: hypothetical protein SCARUB_03347 [Candidatus Scalindua rubra]